MKKNITAFPLVALCLACPLQALEFRVLSWRGEQTGLAYDRGSRRVEIVASAHDFSPPYELAEGAPLELYRQVRTADGRLEKRIAATLPPPPAGAARALLILVASGNDGYKGRWLDDSPEAHPVNTIRVYNFTGRELAIQAGAERWTEASGADRSVPFDPASRQVPVRIAESVGGQWKLALGGPQPVRRGYRVHFLLRDAGGRDADAPGGVEALLFYDRVKTEKRGG